MSADEPLIEIPEGFDLDTARRQQSTTPREEQKRCPEPECGSINIFLKTGRPQPHSHEGRWSCKECGAHFDEPLPPIAECEATEQTTLGGVRMEAQR